MIRELMTRKIYMRATIGIIALIGLTTAGCLSVASQPPLPATTMSSWGPAGGFTMSTGNTCAGHSTLNLGHASVYDPCFTGSDNIVMCTDTTAPMSVQCSPESGYLMITGSGADTISYVRVK